MQEIRIMEESDLNEVVAIEKASFTLPWSRELFLKDVKENNNAHYFVLREEGKLSAYGGFWLLLDEINIVTIAVHPEKRKSGLGGQILKTLLTEGVKLRASLATLEVRVGNTSAIKLYERFGFIQIAVRKKYYSDNGEDALVMWLNPIEIKKEFF